MPVYLDFIFLFGLQSNARDLRFSGFREQIMLKDPLRTGRQSSVISDLNRSGRHFQLSYNLKGVKFTAKNGIQAGVSIGEMDGEWSIRQAAIHHQFDVIYGTALWIVTKGRTDLLEWFERLTSPEGKVEDKCFDNSRSCFRSSLAVHLMFCYWSLEDWARYVSWLEDIVEKRVSNFIILLKLSILSTNELRWSIE